jgi:hypothetical protein
VVVLHHADEMQSVSPTQVVLHVEPLAHVA